MNPFIDFGDGFVTLTCQLTIDGTPFQAQQIVSRLHWNEFSDEIREHIEEDLHRALGDQIVKHFAPQMQVRVHGDYLTGSGF